MKRIAVLVCVLIFGLYTLSLATPSIIRLEAIMQGGSVLVGLKAPTWVDAQVVSNTAVAHTVPTTAKYVLMSGTNSFYACFTGTAVIPTGPVTDGSAPELNPVLRDITGVTTISLIAPSSCVVTLSFYK